MSIKNIVRHTRHKVAKLLVSQGTQKECPICGWTGYCFLSFGAPGKHRFDAKCPTCGSLERQRLAFLTAKEILPLGSLDTLHVAPENCIEPWLKANSMTYVSIDLNNSAMRKMDLCDMEFDDESFSLIWCSNVLEHIVEDYLAIKEMYRVCQPGGVAFIQVPIWRQQTYEDYAITTDKERIEYFYQKDHVRLYGLDIVHRFEDAGFSAKVVRSQDYGPVLVQRHALSFISTNEVFIFKK